MHPALPFSQIHSTDNDDIVMLLGAPLPLGATEALCSGKIHCHCLEWVRPVMNSARIGEEGAGWVCTPFTPLQTMTCAKDRHAGAPSPLTAAEALCSIVKHHH